ncbi:MAG: hypothetical protein ABI411_02600 [Tahibacter sp.]
MNLATTSKEIRGNPWFWICLLFAYACASIYAADGESRGDEIVHFQQILLFRHGDFRVLTDALTTIPGYHATIAFVMWMVGGESLAIARLATGLYGLLAIAGFSRLRRAIHNEDDWVPVAQFAVLPILLPFVFLVYTDTASLACVLWATSATVLRRHWRSALWMIAAIAMRQNNVLWLPFLWLLFVAPRWKEHGIEAWRSVLVDSMPYLLPGSCFIAYWLWNGTVSYSGPQSSMHPDASMHVGNIYFMLFVAALLLPLQCADGALRFVRAAVGQPWLWLIPIGVLIVYLGAFAVDHPYNLIENAVSWRNRILQHTQHSELFRLGFGVAAVIAALGVGWSKLADVSARALFPVAVLFVSLSWLIEQRYYLIPLALFLAWRKPLRRELESITLALWAVLAVLFFWGMISGQLYL